MLVQNLGASTAVIIVIFIMDVPLAKAQARTEPYMSTHVQIPTRTPSHRHTVTPAHRHTQSLELCVRVVQRPRNVVAAFRVRFHHRQLLPWIYARQSYRNCTRQHTRVIGIAHVSIQFESVQVHMREGAGAGEGARKRSVLRTEQGH